MAKDGGAFQGVVQFFTSVTGMVTAFLGLLAAVVGLAATQSGDTAPDPSQPAPAMTSIPSEPAPAVTSIPSETRTDSNSHLERMNEVCNKVAADTAAGDPYVALITGAESLRTMDVPSTYSVPVNRAADEWDEAALTYSHGGDASSLVTTGANRLADLGAADCRA